MQEQETLAERSGICISPLRVYCTSLMPTAAVAPRELGGVVLTCLLLVLCAE